MEAAWRAAEEWQYPCIKKLQFKQVWNWLAKSEFDQCKLATSVLHKTLALLLDVSAPFSRPAALDVLLLCQALEALLDCKSGAIGASLTARANLILGPPPSHKKWLSSFYDLRSKITHGSFPIIRPGSFASDDEIYEHERELVASVNRVVAVLLTLLQKLAQAGASAFQFSESFDYVSMTT